jgi:ABC-type Na+ efflux pump permease subunit
LACEGRKKNGNYGLAVAGVLWSIVFEARFVSFGIGVEVDDVDVMLLVMMMMMMTMMMMMMLALVLVLLLWFFRTPMQSRVQYRMSWCGWCSS